MDLFNQITFTLGFVFSNVTIMTARISNDPQSHAYHSNHTLLNGYFSYIFRMLF